MCLSAPVLLIVNFTFNLLNTDIRLSNSSFPLFCFLKSDKIKEIIELDRHVASRDIAQEMGVSHQTILNHLRKAGYKKFFIKH